MKKVRVLILLLLVGLSFVQAKEKDLQIEKETWKNSIEGLEYVPEEEKPVEPEETEEATDAELPDISGFKYVAYAVVFVIIVALLIMILRNSQPVVKVERERVEAKTLEEAEENLPMVTLNKIYEEALQLSDFKKALRIKFLMVLQTMIDHEMIIWKKRKTNEQYLIELRDASIASMFRGAVQTFDAVWYGEVQITSVQYQAIIAGLDNLNNTISGRGE